MNTARGVFAALLAGLCLSAGPLARPVRADDIPLDPEPRLAFRFGMNMRFGLVILKDAEGRPINKRLTFSPDGATNSTVVRIDGKALEFGGKAGAWAQKEARILNGASSSWDANGVRTTQILQLVPSAQPVFAGGQPRRVLDICLIRWTAQSLDGRPHRVGVRAQVDTLIGGNDGVPFLVPHLSGLVATFRDFPTPAEVPESIQALERPDLRDPGTVGHMTFRWGGSVEPPGRISLTRWPGSDFLPWEVPLQSMAGGRPDSAVVLYWHEQEVAPGATRDMGFAYGLGRLAGGEGTGQLALTTSGTFEAGQTFTLTAYARGGAAGQTVSLEVPDGLRLAEGQATRPVPPAGAGGTGVVTWKLRATRPGEFRLRAHSSTGASQTQRVTIAGPRLPPDAGKLAHIVLPTAAAVGEVFRVTAAVYHPLPGQALTLDLPPGLQCVEGPPRPPVPPPAGTKSEGAITWTVKVVQPGRHEVTVRSSTGASKKRTVTVAAPQEPAAGTRTKGGNFRDAMLALRMSVRLVPEDLALDADGDGRVTAADAALLARGRAAALTGKEP